MTRLSSADLLLYLMEMAMFGLYLFSQANPSNPLVQSLLNLPTIQGMNAILELWMFMNIPFMAIYVKLKKAASELVES